MDFSDWTSVFYSQLLLIGTPEIDAVWLKNTTISPILAVLCMFQCLHVSCHFSVILNQQYMWHQEENCTNMHASEYYNCYFEYRQGNF
jgi:hypothetical protein